jgi:hypothetical protein
MNGREQPSKFGYSNYPEKEWRWSWQLWGTIFYVSRLVVSQNKQDTLDEKASNEDHVGTDKVHRFTVSWLGIMLDVRYIKWIKLLGCIIRYGNYSDDSVWKLDLGVRRFLESDFDIIMDEATSGVLLNEDDPFYLSDDDLE